MEIREPHRFPRSLGTSPRSSKFSFSGLKTAVRYLLNPPEKTQRRDAEVAGNRSNTRRSRSIKSRQRRLSGLRHREKVLADIAASFQAAVIDCLAA